MHFIASRRFCLPPQNTPETALLAQIIHPLKVRVLAYIGYAHQRHEPKDLPYHSPATSDINHIVGTEKVSVDS